MGECACLAAVAFPLIRKEATQFRIVLVWRFSATATHAIFISQTLRSMGEGALVAFRTVPVAAPLPARLQQSQTL